MRIDAVGVGLAVLLSVSGMAGAAEQALEAQAEPVKSGGVTPKSVATDQNKDGKPDQWEYYEAGVISRLESDTNYDGQVDEVAYFEDKRLARGEKDMDHDGKMDQWFTY